MLGRMKCRIGKRSCDGRRHRLRASTLTLRLCTCPTILTILLLALFRLSTRLDPAGTRGTTRPKCRSRASDYRQLEFGCVVPHRCGMALRPRPNILGGLVVATLSVMLTCLWQLGIRALSRMPGDSPWTLWT